jgi:hypothetical protein
MSIVPDQFVDTALFLTGDITNDNSVTVDDFNVLVAAFGSCSTDGGYNPLADLNDSGCVDITDFALFVGHFGTSGCSTI